MAKQQSDKLARQIFMLIPILGLACLIVSIGLAIHSGEFTLATEAGVLAGILLFLAIFIKAEVANLKYYLNVFVYAAFVCGICVVGYLFARQYKPQIDLTANHIYSLDPQTKDFLHRLGQDVDVIFFSSNLGRNIRDIEESYTNETKRLKFEFLNSNRDVEKTLARAKELGVSNPSPLDVIVQSGKKTKRLSVGDLVRGNYENALNNAIIEVTAKGSVKVYFTTGHGELSLNASKPRTMEEAQEQAQKSLMLLKQLLDYGAIPYAPLDLLAKGAVPDDATAIVIAGPSSDFTDPELAQLRAYLDKGGRLMVVLGPQIRGQHETYEKLTAMLRDYGIDLPDDIVFDLVARQLGNWANPIANYLDPKHPITAEPARGGTRFQLSLARPVETTRVKDNKIEAVELIRTSDRSFAFPLEKLLAGERATAPADSDLKAEPIGVAVAMAEPPQIPGRSIPKPKSYRLLVYGSNDLVTGALIRPQGRELMLNSMGWLTEREDAMNLQPKQMAGTPIILTDAQAKVMFVFAVILIPGALFFGGVSYSLMRRRK